MNTQVTTTKKQQLPIVGAMGFNPSNLTLNFNVQRQMSVRETVLAMGASDAYINKMDNLVVPVKTMDDGVALMKAVYNSFGIRSSITITSELNVKVYFDPKTKADGNIALAFAQKNGLLPPPSDSRKAIIG